jgi:hypothetical protein
MKPGSILLFLVLMTSGNPAAFVVPNRVVYAALLALFLVYWIVRPTRLDRRTLAVLAVFVGLIGAHVASFGSLVVPASVGFAIKLLVAVFAAKTIPDLPGRFVTVMAWLALFSLLFHVPHLLGLPPEAVFWPLRAPLDDGDLFHIFVHNFHKEGAGRNSGLFWEPGAFAGYLVVALLFATVGARRRAASWKIAAILVGIASTASTTGFVASALVLMYLAWTGVKFRNAALRLVVPPMIALPVIAVGVVAYNELPFLGEKVASQIDKAMAGVEGAEINRFGNLLFDVNYIVQRPLTGWSATPETRAALDSDISDVVAGQGNGLTGLLVRFGLIGFLAVALATAASIARWSGSWLTGVFSVGILSMLMFGEQFHNYPFLWCLCFLGHPPAPRPKVPGRRSVGARTVVPHGAAPSLTAVNP